MNKGKQISLNFVMQMISFVVNLCISFFLTPYIIQFIGKDIYGFASLAMNFTSYASIITTALNSMLSRYVTIAVSQNNYPKASEYMTSVLIANIAAMLFLTPISCWLIYNLSSVIKIPVGFEADIKLLFAIIFAGFLVNLPGGVFCSATYACNRLDKSNWCNLISSIIRIIVTFGLLLTLKPHVWYIGLAGTISTIYMICKNYRYKKQLLPEIKISIQYFKISAVKELIGVGLWNTINQLSQILLTGLDLVIANLFISVTGMNLLSYAKMLPAQVLSLVSMTAGLFAPILTIAYGKGVMKDFVCEIHSAIRTCGFLCAVPVVGLMIFGESFFALWLKALSPEEIRIVANLSMLTVLPQFFSVYIFPLYSVSSITTKLRYPVMMTMLLGVLNVIIVFALVQMTDMGLYAVAGVSSMLGMINIFIFTPMYVAWTIKQPLTLFYKTLFKGIKNNFLLVAVFLFIRKIIPITGWGSFIMACIVAGAFGYLISFTVLFDKNEKSRIINKAIIKIKGAAL